MRFDQTSDNKYDMYLYGKLSTKPLGQAANKNTRSNRSQVLFKLGVLKTHFSKSVLKAPYLQNISGGCF